MTSEEKSQDGETIVRQGQSIVKELENLMGAIYADLEVSREKVKALTERGRELAEDEESWPGGAKEAAEFRGALDKMEKKIHETLDLKKLKEEGLVKAVRF